MIPTFSPVPDVRPHINMQHSPMLPPFTPHSRLRATSQNRGVSPWQHARVPERFPQLSKMASAWKARDDSYLEHMTLLSPTINPEQHKSFQSTTVLRSVPIMRRHLDTFGGRTFSLPAKTKPVPFHTGRFIYDPHNRPIFLEELTQNQRLEAEVAMVEKVRGLKRKREALEHRWGWRKFNLLGCEISCGERYSLQAEIKKLKELILPATARDIYTGRGIRLPEHHHTKRSVKRPTPNEQPVPPPPTSTLDAIREPYVVKPSPSPQPRRQQTVSKTARSRERSTFKHMGSQLPPRQSVDLLVQSVPIPGISMSPTPRYMPDKANDKLPEKMNEPTSDNTQEPQPQPTPIMKMHEPVEQIEMVEPLPSFPDDEESEKIKDISPLISDTPVNRSRSMAAPSASPDGKAHSNPLISISAMEDSITSEDDYMKLKTKYDDIDQQKTGHISFEQLQTIFPIDLSESQRRFLQCLYDLTTQNQLFGAEEFVAIALLSQRIFAMKPSIQAMFEQTDFAKLEESLVQYTELFRSVDRAGRGRIGVGALLQILSTALNRQIEPNTKLAEQITETIEKDYSGDVPKLDFLAFIPYYLYLEEMT